MRDAPHEMHLILTFKTNLPSVPTERANGSLEPEAEAADTAASRAGSGIDAFFEVADS
jgi:hypothetical protein